MSYSNMIEQYIISQDGRNYDFTLEVLDSDTLRVHCKEQNDPCDGEYVGDYTYQELKDVNPIFYDFPTLEDAVLEMDEVLVKHLCGVIDDENMFEVVVYMDQNNKNAKVPFLLEWNGDCRLHCGRHNPDIVDDLERDQDRIRDEQENLRLKMDEVLGYPSDTGKPRRTLRSKPVPEDTYTQPRVVKVSEKTYQPQQPNYPKMGLPLPPKYNRNYRNESLIPQNEEVDNNAFDYPEHNKYKSAYKPPVPSATGYLRAANNNRKSPEEIDYNRYSLLKQGNTGLPVGQNNYNNNYRPPEPSRNNNYRSSAPKMGLPPGISNIYYPQSNNLGKTYNQPYTPPQPTLDSKIVTPYDLDFVMDKIHQFRKNVNPNLIYRGSRDGDKASDFHEKCDRANGTIVLVQTTNRKKFGGYTSQSWSGDYEDKNDVDAFIFSIDKQKTYDVIADKTAIGAYPDYGPIFFGCQIRIYDNYFHKGGTTYKRQKNYMTDEDFELTGGSQNFDILELEVFEVV